MQKYELEASLNEWVKMVYEEGCSFREIVSELKEAQERIEKIFFPIEENS